MESERLDARNEGGGESRGKPEQPGEETRMDVQADSTGDSPEEIAARSRAASRMEICISRSRMCAAVKEYIPPSPGEPPLDVQAVQLALDQAGVTDGIDHDAIAKAVVESAAGNSFKGLVLAKGTQPESSSDETFEPRGDLRFPVMRGDVFGDLIPGAEARLGCDVTGDTLTPPVIRGPRPLNAPEGCGVQIDRESGELAAELAGVVEQDGQDLSMRGLIRVTEDRLTVHALIYDRDFLGRPISVESIVALLAPLKITAGVDRDAIERAIAKAADGLPRDTVVAMGVRAVKGQDGRFESELRFGLEAGRSLDDGRVDYYERGLVRAVAAGDVIGRLVSATAGVPGRDVFGAVLDARDGEPVALEAGQNVEVGEGGELRATIDGTVIMAQGLIQVTETVSVEGDVDFNTGNIRMDKGSVHVRGSIRHGFTVISAGNIIVDGSIEGATVEAGGDVIVKGGISMQETGLVRAGGDISAMFVANAKLEADGDVVVCNEIINSTITTRGRLKTTSSQGKIMGGHVKAEKGVEAGDIGSHMGVVSSLDVGVMPPANQALRDERKSVKATLSKIDSAFGTKSDEEILQGTEAAKQKLVAKLLVVRRKSRERLASLAREIEEDRERRRSLTCARIKVNGTLYADTDILLYGLSWTMEEDKRSVVLVYDFDAGALREGP